MDLINKESMSKDDEDDTNEKSCIQCKSTQTPLWRTGPAGPKTLCNACGIKYRKTILHVPSRSSLDKTTTGPKIAKTKPESQPNRSWPPYARSRTKSGVQSGSLSAKLGNLQKSLAWRLNSSPLRLRRKVYDRYTKLKPSPPTGTTTITTTTTTADTTKTTVTAVAVNKGDAAATAETSKSVKIGLRTLGKEVEWLQGQRSSTAGREEEEEAAALLISLSKCGSVMV